MYTKNTKKLFLTLAASCLLFQPGVAPPTHAMLPVGDSVNRNFYKNQDFIWETNKAESRVRDASSGSGASTVASKPEVTSKSARPLSSDIALLFPPPPRTVEQVALLFPPPPRTGEEVALLFPPPPRTGEELALLFPPPPRTGDELALLFPPPPRTGRAADA